MFKKNPDQAHERKIYLFTGIIFIIIGIIFYAAGAGILSLVFFIPGFVVIPIAVLADHTRFESAKRFLSIFAWFT